MYRMYMIDDETWQIHATGKAAYEGNLKQIMKHCIHSLGFEFEDLEAAVMEMNKRGHNGAEFGVLKGFIFTFENAKHRRFH